MFSTVMVFRCRVACVTNTTFGLLWTILIVVPGVILVILPIGVAGAAHLALLSESIDPGELAGR